MGVSGIPTWEAATATREVQVISENGAVNVWQSMPSAIAAAAADGDFSAADENEVYKNKNTGENRTIIEIPLFDETDKRRIRKYLSSP